MFVVHSIILANLACCVVNLAMPVPMPALIAEKSNLLLLNVGVWVTVFGLTQVVS